MGEPPKSLDVTFTDRGFECVVNQAAAGGCATVGRRVIPLFLLANFFGLFFGFVFLADAVGDAAVLFAMLGIAGMFVVAIVAFILIGVLNRKKPQMLVLDGNELRFVSMDGPVRMKLQEIKAIDVVPIGLGVRPHKGQTHHVLMTGASEAERVWLDNAIESARDRHGTASEVPEEIRELRD